MNVTRSHGFLHEMCDAILLIQAKRLSKCSVDLFLLDKSIKQSLEQLRHPKLINLLVTLRLYPKIFNNMLLLTAIYCVKSVYKQFATQEQFYISYNISLSRFWFKIYCFSPRGCCLFCLQQRMDFVASCKDTAPCRF